MGSLEELVKTVHGIVALHSSHSNKPLFYLPSPKVPLATSKATIWRNQQHQVNSDHHSSLPTSPSIRAISTRSWYRPSFQRYPSSSLQASTVSRKRVRPRIPGEGADAHTMEFALLETSSQRPFDPFSIIALFLVGAEAEEVADFAWRHNGLVLCWV